MAIIFRPNSGINNALAGFAAGLGQGMQLGIQKDKLEVERERLAFAMSEAERRAGLELAADARAKAQEDRAAQLFQLGIDERAADKEARGYLAEAQDARMALDSGEFAPPQLPPQFSQRGPQQSNIYTGQPIMQNFDRMMTGLSGQQYQNVRSQYSKSMEMAGKLASRMSPEMARMYMQERERQALMIADDEARKSFGSMVADQRGRGAFRILGPQGQEVDDPQLESTIQMLLEQAQNPNVPLQQTQSALNNVLQQISTNNVKARDFQFQSARIDSGIAKAIESGNEGAAKALQEVKQFMSQNPFATPEQLSTRYEAAMNGRVERTLPDGKPIFVSAVNADKEYEAEVQKYEELRSLKLDLAKAEKELTEARTTSEGRRYGGMNASQAVNAATREYNALSDDQKYELEVQGILPAQYVNARAAEMMQMYGGTPAGAVGAGVVGQAPAGMVRAPSGTGAGAPNGTNTRTVALGGKSYVLTDENTEQLNREADALGIKDGGERRRYASWRMQNPNAEPSGYKPSAPAANGEGEEVETEQPAQQIDAEQAKANLNRLSELSGKENKTLAEEVEYRRLKNSASEYQAAVSKQFNLEAAAQKEKEAYAKSLTEMDASVEQAIDVLTRRQYSAGEARRELFGEPQTQEEFDLMMEYATSSKGAKNYATRIALLGQAKGFDASGWKDHVEVLSGDKLEAAKRSYQKLTAAKAAQEQAASDKAAKTAELEERRKSSKPWFETGEFKSRMDAQAANMQRVLGMSEAELKKELVDAYGYDIRSLTEFLAKYSPEEIRLALADVGQGRVGLDRGPAKDQQMTGQLRNADKARQAQLRSQLGARLRQQLRR